MLGDILQCIREVCFCQDQNSQQFLRVCARGIFRSEPRFLKVFTNANDRSFSAGTRVPGDIFQFGQSLGSRQYLPIRVQGVCRSEKKCLAIFTDLDARRLSIRTKTPGNVCQCKCDAFSVRPNVHGDISQFKCEAFFGQN